MHILIVVAVQHSWKWFIYYRCQNVNRHSKDEGCPRKRAKIDEQAHAHFYPPIHAEDEVSFGQNLELLREESEKAKPQSDVLKELMRRTFPNRWEAYTSKNEPATLLEYLKEYPLLKKAPYVSFCVYMKACMCPQNNKPMHDVSTLHFISMHIHIHIGVCG